MIFLPQMQNQRQTKLCNSRRIGISKPNVIVPPITRRPSSITRLTASARKKKFVASALKMKPNRNVSSGSKKEIRSTGTVKEDLYL